ncbi:MAG: ABC transporter permease [Anaerolineaceae bacterium]
MRNLWKIARYEFTTTVTRRSFLLTLILLPLIPAVLLGLLNILNRGTNNNLLQIFSNEVANPLPVGVLDQSRLVNDYPDWLVKGNIVRISDESSGREAVNSGRLQGYYIIDADYLDNGKVTLVKPEINLFSGMVQSQLVTELINYNLMGSSADLYLRYTNPIQFEVTPINAETADTRDTSNMANYFVPYGVTMFFYFMIISSSNMMLTAIGREKDNRVMEVLISSTNPLSLFLGKILALSMVGLLQMVIWFGSAIGLMRLAGQSFDLLKGVVIPWSSLAMAIPIFLLGYFIFGSLMAGIGAITPNLKEGGQATFVVTIPLIVTILAIGQLIQAPSSPISVGLSLFPLTSPVAMMTRLSIGKVPLLQIVICIALLVVTAWLAVNGVAKLFRAQTLLTGQKFQLRPFLKAMLSR